MPVWSYRGGSVSTVTTGANFDITEPAGAAQGDLLIISVVVRNGEVPTVSGAWTYLGSSPTTSNAIVGNASSISQIFTWWMIRGASAPSYTVTRGAGASVASWAAMAVTPEAGLTVTASALSSSTMTVAGNTVTTTGITTAANDALIYVVTGVGRNASMSNFVAATSPTVASGGGSQSYTGPMTLDAWERRGLSSTGTDPDVGVCQAIAVKSSAGPTGDISATSSLTVLASFNVVSFTQSVAGRSATLAVTEAADTVSAAGLAGRTATAANQIVDDMSSFGDVLGPLVGSLAQTEEQDTLSSSAVKTSLGSGSMTQTEGEDTVSSNARVRIAGTLAQTEAADTSSSFSNLRIAATFAVTEASDTLSSGVSFSKVSNLSVVEADDILSSTMLNTTQRLFLWADPRPPNRMVWRDPD